MSGTSLSSSWGGMVTVNKGNVSFDIREVDVKDVPKFTRRGIWSDTGKDILLRLQATTDGKALMLTFNDVATAKTAKVALSRWFWQHRGSGAVSISKRDNRLYITRGANWPGKTEAPPDG